MILIGITGTKGVWWSPSTNGKEKGSNEGRLCKVGIKEDSACWPAQKIKKSNENSSWTFIDARWRFVKSTIRNRSSKIDFGAASEARGIIIG